MAIDIEKLLAEVSPDAPAGPDLSYDPAYYELMREAEGTPSQSIGDAVIEGADPNWREVKTKALALMGRTKDLNVALNLAVALLSTEGVRGLRDGIALLKGLLEKHWDHFHPKLDPDDDNDPLERCNLIASLAAPLNQDGDPLQFRKRLRLAPLASSRQLGQYNLRQVLIATGSVQPASGEDPIDRGVIDGAFADTDPDELKATAEAAAEAQKLSRELDEWLTSKVGAGKAPDLTGWHDALKELNHHLADQLAKRGLGAAPAPDQGAAPAAGGHAQAGAVAPAGPAPAPLSGSINSRDDVITALNKIIDYYAKAEPSSPVPLLLHRARRLASMSFIDIIRDLTPDAVNQLKVVGGAEAFEQISANSSSNSETSASGPRPAPKTKQDFEPVRLT